MEINITITRLPFAELGEERRAQIIAAKRAALRRDYNAPPLVMTF